MLVFVYGSLMKGLHNNYILETAEFQGKDFIPSSTYSMYSLGGFPGLIKDTSGSIISGEVYKVDDETLQRLDRLEGNGHFYTREFAKTSSGLDVEVYVLPKERVYGLPKVTPNNDDASVCWRKAYYGGKNSK